MVNIYLYKNVNSQNKQKLSICKKNQRGKFYFRCHLL